MERTKTKPLRVLAAEHSASSKASLKLGAEVSRGGCGSGGGDGGGGGKGDSGDSGGGGGCIGKKEREEEEY